MKKLFLLAAALSVAFTGCVNEKSDDLGYGGDAQKEITFANPVLTPSTRALIGDGVNYPTGEKFSVFAYLQPVGGEAFATQGWNLPSQEGLFMKDVEVHHDGNNPGTWESIEVYYWPKNDQKLAFAAYSPSSLTADYNKTGLKITGFDCTDGKMDVLYSDRTVDQVKPGTTSGPYAGVDINFKHALSAVRFTLNTDANYTGVEFSVKSIALKSILKKASFEQGIEATATTGCQADAWTAVGPAETLTYNILSAPTTVTYNASTPTTFAGETLALIPQTFSDATPVVEIVWSVKQHGGPEVTTTTTKDLQSLTAKWETSKRYTYNVKLGLDKITFNPIVDGWTDTAVDANLNN